MHRKILNKKQKWNRVQGQTSARKMKLGMSVRGKTKEEDGRSRILLVVGGSADWVFKGGGGGGRCPGGPPERNRKPPACYSQHLPQFFWGALGGKIGIFTNTINSQKKNNKLNINSIPQVTSKFQVDLILFWISTNGSNLFSNTIHCLLTKQLIPKPCKKSMNRWTHFTFN